MNHAIGHKSAKKIMDSAGDLKKKFTTQRVMPV